MQKDGNASDKGEMIESINATLKNEDLLRGQMRIQLLQRRRKLELSNLYGDNTWSLKLNETEEATNSTNMQRVNRRVGLVNQGCTCYMNSLMQNLFMLPQFRTKVLKAPLKICSHREFINLRDRDKLVGRRIQFYDRYFLHFSTIEISVSII